MYRAVHADRSGRVIVSVDQLAVAFDGAATAVLTEAVPLPPTATLVPLDREAEGLERGGRTYRVGSGRSAVGALLPAGHLRTHLPAYADAPGRPELEPRAYAAVAADEHGELVTAAVVVDSDPTHDATAYDRGEIAARVNATLRDRAGDRIVRQLARCAREYACHGAANAFLRRWECALPVAAPANERPVAAIAPRRGSEADPREPAAFHPDADEVAALALAHIEAGGTLVSFGRACEGEPLLAARVIEPAIERIRAATRAGTIHLETNGSQPAMLRRLARAGLDSVTVRVVSARPEAYEVLHRPEGYRFGDVRASVRAAAEEKLAASLLVEVLPGIFDRPDEVDAIASLAGELPEGGTLLLRDLAADARRVIALLADRDAPVGVARAVDRLRERLPHVRVGAFVRPLARI